MAGRIISRAELEDVRGRQAAAQEYYEALRDLPKKRTKQKQAEHEKVLKEAQDEYVRLTHERDYKEMVFRRQPPLSPPKPPELFEEDFESDSSEDLNEEKVGKKRRRDDPHGGALKGGRMTDEQLMAAIQARDAALGALVNYDRQEYDEDDPDLPVASERRTEAERASYRDAVLDTSAIVEREIRRRRLAGEALPFPPALPVPPPPVEDPPPERWRPDFPKGGALTGGGPTQVDEQLDDSDVKRVSGLPNLRVVRYPDMARFPTWDAMLGPAGAAAVLFLTESATSGHWLAAFNGPDDTAHIFDPLGIGLDKQKDELGAEKASELGQDRAEFSRLLKTTSRRPVVNHEDFQAFNPQVQTCGRWVGLRIAAKDMKDPQFKSMVEKGIKATGAGSADDWVTKVTNPTLDSDDEGNTEF